MYKCPKCGATSSEMGNCATCNVPLVPSEPAAPSSAVTGSEATTENKPPESN